jgi:thioredoxin reductase
VVFDSGTPRNAPAEAMHNMLGRDGTPPEGLRADGRRELAAYPTVSVRSEAVDSVIPEFAVTLTSGEVVRGRRLLLATGVVDDLLPIPGLTDRWGRTVLHCPYCHGYEQRGKRLAVLGSTPHHVFIATLLRRYSEDVVLLTNGDEPPADVLGLEVFAEPVAGLAGAADVVFADGSRLERDAIFAGRPAPQHATFAADLGCALLPDGSVEVDDFGRTSVPGVSAAGDMAHRASLPGPMAAIAVASAAGLVAAVALDQDLHATDTGLPSPLDAALRRVDSAA